MAKTDIEKLSDEDRKVVNAIREACDGIGFALWTAREIQDALRDGDAIHEAEEVADAIIRLMDYAAWRGINLEHEIDRKMKKNLTRAVLHGRKGF